MPVSIKTREIMIIFLLNKDVFYSFEHLDKLSVINNIKTVPDASTPRTDRLAGNYAKIYLANPTTLAIK